MYAIVTRYHGPTNTRGARISATWGRHRATIPYPHELDTAAAHAAAARAVLVKAAETGSEFLEDVTFFAGALPDGTGYAYAPVWIQDGRYPDYSDSVSLDPDDDHGR